MRSRTVPAIEFMDAEPLPIPRHPYTRDEIEDYVERFLSCKTANAKKKMQIERRLIAYFEKLPPWVQVLVIENDVPINIDTQKKLKLGSWAIADSKPDMYDINLRISLFSAPDDEMELMLSHEVGHVVDNILGRARTLPRDTGTQYLSGAIAAWTTAFQKDVTLPNGRSKNNLNNELRKLLSIDKLYTAYDAPFESFAVIFSHYLNDYIKGDDESGIDTKMEKFFPNLWPVFRDTMLPEALHVTSRSYHRRQEDQAHAFAYISQNIQKKIDAAIAYHQCPPLQDKDLSMKLMKQGYAEYERLFEALAAPLPDGVTPRLKTLFPAIFDPVWAGEGHGRGKHKKAYTARSFPLIKLPAETFVMNITDILKHEGVEAVVKDWQDLREAFERAIHQKEITPRR
jgi:hypothetical protein